MHHHVVKAAVGYGEIFGILVAPSKWRELVSPDAFIKIRNGHICKAGVLKNITVKLSTANNKHGRVAGNVRLSKHFSKERYGSLMHQFILTTTNGRFSVFGPWVRFGFVPVKRPVVCSILENRCDDEAQPGLMLRARES
jgi:hypothetical protein